MIVVCLLQYTKVGNCHISMVTCLCYIYWNHSLINCRTVLVFVKVCYNSPQMDGQSNDL